MSHKKHDRRVKRQRHRVQEDRTYDVEAAYELTGQDLSDRDASHEAVEERDVSSGLGYTAVGFAIASLFLFPITLGLTSIALGFLSFFQGSRTAGTTAIIIGTMAMLIRSLFISF